MINKQCVCYNKIELTENGEGVDFCVYNNSMDFACDKCCASREDKSDAIAMTEIMEQSLRAKRKRR